MADIHPTIRDGEIHAAVERRRVDDTKILQKVNAVNRVAFTSKFPGQLEHHLRLVSERLQACLHKDADTVLNDPTTWPASADEIFALSHALRNLNEIRRDWPLSDQD
jgi:hypothetical protein